MIEQRPKTRLQINVHLSKLPVGIMDKNTTNCIKIGYARVSTDDQNPELQIDALKAAGCDRVFVDTISGVKAERAELDKAKDLLRSGDTLVVWRLDRLGRSLKDLITWMRELGDQDINFESIQEKIDTATSTGKLVFHIFGAIAEFERDLIRERTSAGLLAARARGRKGGRKAKLEPKQRQAIRELYHSGGYTVKELLGMYNISRSLFYTVISEGTGTSEVTTVKSISPKNVRESLSKLSNQTTIND